MFDVSGLSHTSYGSHTRSASMKERRWKLRVPTSQMSSRVDVGRVLLRLRKAVSEVEHGILRCAPDTA
eukprot:53758-Eustigmatos_ZCMA.PRE.1